MTGMLVLLSAVRTNSYTAELVVCDLKSLKSQIVLAVGALWWGEASHQTILRHPQFEAF